MGFVHQNKHYVFGFSIPVVSFSYIDCIGANTVPRWQVAPRFHKFTLTTLYGDAWKPVVCRPVLRSGLYAPKQGLHFWILNSGNFPFIYRLYWCKHGTTMKGSSEFPQISTDGINGDEWKPVICMPVLRSGLSAPKQGLHFWVLHFRSFLFIYRLHWCKHGTTVKGSPEFPKISTDGHIRRWIKTGSLQACTAKWALCTKISITFLGSPFR